MLRPLSHHAGSGTRLGHEVVEITSEHIRTRGGFVSEHFTEERLRSLIGLCAISAIGYVAYLAQA